MKSRIESNAKTKVTHGPKLVLLLLLVVVCWLLVFGFWLLVVGCLGRRKMCVCVCVKKHSTSRVQAATKLVLSVQAWRRGPVLPQASANPCPVMTGTKPSSCWSNASSCRQQEHPQNDPHDATSSTYVPRFSSRKTENLNNIRHTALSNDKASSMSRNWQTPSGAVLRNT